MGRHLREVLEGFSKNVSCTSQKQLTESLLLQIEKASADLENAAETMSASTNSNDTHIESIMSFSNFGNLYASMSIQPQAESSENIKISPFFNTCKVAVDK